MPKKKNNFFGQLKFTLPEEIKKLLWGSLMFLLSLIFALSFFELAGGIGKFFKSIFFFLIGKTIFLFPLIFILFGASFFYSQPPTKLGRGANLFLAFSFLIIGVSGILELLKPGGVEGGIFGKLIAGMLFKGFFGFWLSQIIFVSFIILSGIIFWQLFKPLKEEKEILTEKESLKEKKSIISRMFEKAPGPKLRLKQIEPPSKIALAPVREITDLKLKPLGKVKKFFYQPPPLNLLESEKEIPSSGDIKVNSAIIKKTLQNFDIPVEMGEVNIGPTVTQFTLKPADGIKLSKITVLSNDLALALAVHPIRIEAPIPGRPLVGIEVPNKLRAKVRLRELISNQNFQNSFLNLTFVLGRDVSGNPVYTDLAKMPHLLVAGSTGSGKTLFLNSLLLSLLYRPPNNFNPFGGGPEILRFILIDPKRVEFPIYNELPHLLCPVICDPQRAVNVLKWLISEMERRFDLLSENKARDISAYNEMAIRKEEEPPLPYIILIIDELADLMAARGKEVEAGIVRIAQMARAVGIHLVIATQRPSVEVITGLIKANITTRIAFQVASQVDSRTILDMAGAEKLLGLGDLLFISAEVTKPKRLQAPYVSEKEVKGVVDYVRSKSPEGEPSAPYGAGKEQRDQVKISDEILREGLELPETIGISQFQELGEDPLYESAKRVVIEAKKASASLLQRRLRIGYARAARLLDILEKNGIVGPADGAKPREILFKTEENNEENNEEWKKI